MKAKRELILQSALELFMENGVNGLKVSSIAAKADIGKGTVYEYFSSKEDLFIGAVEYGISRVITMIKEKLTDEDSFKESFDSVIDCIYDVISMGPFLSIMSDPANMPFSKGTIGRMKVVMGNALDMFIEMFNPILEKGVKEGVISPAESPEYIKAILLIVSNMTMQHVHSNEGDFESLKSFYYTACIKLFA